MIDTNLTFSGRLGRRLCGECINCGYCFNADGFGECVPGDADGSFIRDDCYDYEFTGGTTGGRDK